MKNILSKLQNKFNSLSNRVFEKNEDSLLAIGIMLSKQQQFIQSNNINDYEFKIFSQFGDDGLIHYLTKNLNIENNIFIEFGVENYLESNTRFLMMNDNWEGFVMDGSTKAMEKLTRRRWFWKYNLTCKSIFITKENINELMQSTGFSNIGLLHIDIDGNDYYILEEMDLTRLNPSIIIMEYNSVFGNERAITTLYKKDFTRTKAHFSNLYFGASLPALTMLAEKKGYALVCCNLAGNNAYYVRKDLLNDKVKAVSNDQAYKESKFRESRDKDYALSHLSGKERIEAIRGLEVLNVSTNKKELI